MTVTSKPSSCPECGSGLIGASGAFDCADSIGLGCTWSAVLESNLPKPEAQA